jgi:fatty acid desaturase
VKAAGLLRRRPGSYVLRAAVLVVLFAIGFALLFGLGRTWWQLLVAVYFSVVFTQTAFLAHDSAHKQIFTSGRAGEFFSHFIGNLVVGLSYGWWMNKHTRHHANPNTVGRDNDIAPGPIAFVPADARRRTGWKRWLTARQGYYFIPILTLARLREGVFIGLRLIGFPLLVVLALGPVLGIAFMVVQIASFGIYMGGTFALNHTGMPQIAHDQKVDYLRRQVLTSRNIGGGWFMEVVMGGLNLQIEHHLFPNMPSANLRRLRPMVRDYCDELGVPYEENSFLRAWLLVLRYLHRVGTGHARPFDCPAAEAFRTA